MVIKNATILNENFMFEKKDVEFKEKIEKIEGHLDDENYLDGENLFLIPGFIDIHTHGCVGGDGCDGDLDVYEKMANQYAKKGVTSFLMTTMSLPITDLENILSTISTFIEHEKGDAYAHGIYLEGPFFNTDKKGAQNGEYLKTPDIKTMQHLIDVSKNNIKVVAFAPELKMEDGFIETFSKKLSLSIAHSASKYDQAKTAFSVGVKSVTHLFNAMLPYHHREPGVIGAAFDTENIFMEIICDGIHVHPAVIRNTFRQAGKDRMILISDSMCATGLADGNYKLGGQDVTVNGSTCLLSNGALAGSATDLFKCVKNAIEFGIEKETAIKAATQNPARLIGVDNVTGSISKGKNADLLLVDKDFNLIKTFVKGREI